MLLVKNTKLGSFELPMTVSVVVLLVVTIVLHLDDDYIEAEGERMRERKKGGKKKKKKKGIGFPWQTQLGSSYYVFENKNSLTLGYPSPIWVQLPKEYYFLYQKSFQNCKIIEQNTRQTKWKPCQKAITWHLLLTKSNAPTWTRVAQNPRNLFWWFKKYHSPTTNRNPRQKPHTENHKNHVTNNLHKKS